MASKSYVVPDNQLSLFDLQTPSMPVFDKSRCEAKLINYETAARMVETYHYAHRVPGIKYAFGLFIDDILSGCATYNTPPTANQRRCICGDEYELNVLELNRLFIHDWAGKNCESWLIGQSFQHLENTQYNILLSYADEGQGHYGYIYQATNWLYTGKQERSNSGVIINGIEYHDMTIRDTFGSQKKEDLRKIDPNVIFIDATPKHRYVYFLGSKSQKRKLRKALKWPVLPYPKASDNELTSSP